MLGISFVRQVGSNLGGDDQKHGLASNTTKQTSPFDSLPHEAELVAFCNTAHQYLKPIVRMYFIATLN